MCDDVEKNVENINFRNEHDYFIMANEYYVKRVVEFMAKIESLTMGFFGVNTSNEPLVDLCLRHAIAKGVEHVILISHCCNLRFPFWFFPETKVSSTLKHLHLKHLHLRYFALKPPPEFNGFHSLESLVLDCTNVNEDLFKSLLSNPVIPLSVLRLRSCRLRFDLEIVNPSLHHFEMFNCTHLGSLTLSAIKLAVFEYYSPYKLNTKVFLNAPQMTNLYFHKLAENQIPAVISRASLANVENLNLQIVTEEVMSRSITPFWNLKQLELTVESIDMEEGFVMLLVFSFLKASPLLQKLKLTRLPSAPAVCREVNNEKWKLPQDFSHNELTEVKSTDVKLNSLFT